MADAVVASLGLAGIVGGLGFIFHVFFGLLLDGIDAVRVMRRERAS